MNPGILLKLVRKFQESSQVSSQVTKILSELSLGGPGWSWGGLGLSELVSGGGGWGVLMDLKRFLGSFWCPSRGFWSRKGLCNLSGGEH